MATWQGSGWAEVAERYQITADRSIVAMGKPERVRRYDPWEFPEIVSALASVYPGDDAAVLGFAHQWGLTGSWTDHPNRLEWGKEPVTWLEQHAAAELPGLQLERQGKFPVAVPEITKSQNRQQNHLLEMVGRVEKDLLLDGQAK